MTRADRNALDTQISPLCPRCGNERETHVHRYWGCKHNDTLALENEAVRKAHYLASRALVQLQSVPCLWLRGIMPLNWDTPKSKPCSEDEPKRFLAGLEKVEGETDEWPSDCVVWWTDLSGGRYAPDQRRMRCGWAAVAMRTNRAGEPVEVKAAVWGPLPGDEQTVHRAELNAVIEVVQKALASAELWFAIDCRAVAERLQQGDPAGCGSGNSDLYEALWMNIEVRSVR